MAPYVFPSQYHVSVDNVYPRKWICSWLVHNSWGSQCLWWGVKYDHSQAKLWSMHQSLHRGECWCTRKTHQMCRWWLCLGPGVGCLKFCRWNQEHREYMRIRVLVASGNCQRKEKDVQWENHCQIWWVFLGCWVCEPRAKGRTWLFCNLWEGKINEPS